MKKILCVLVAAVLLLSGTTAVGAADFQEVKNMIPVARQTVVLDEEYSAEIIDYEYLSDEISVFATTSQKSHKRTYRIYRTSDNVTMVEWVLTGIFTYNGSTSKCESANNVVYNYSGSVYTVITASEDESGCYAVGNCGAINNETGKTYSHTIKFGVDPDGNII